MGVLEGCSRVIKYIFFFFTFVFWIIGLASIAIGIWALVDEDFTEFVDLKIPQLDSHALSQAATLLIVVGVMVMIIGFLGCWGAMKENQCFLGLFSILLFLIFVLMVAGAVIAYAYQGVLEKIVTEGIEELKEGYNNNSDYKTSLNKIQQKFQCCEFVTDIPTSCYPHSSTNGTTPATPTGTPFKDKCAPKVISDMNEALDKYKYQIGGIGIAAAIIVLLGVVVSMGLCCKIRRGYQNV